MLTYFLWLRSALPTDHEYLYVCVFPCQFPAAASACVWPHLIYMLRPTFTDYLFQLFASEDRGVDSSLPQWILLRYMYTLTQPGLPTAPPSGKGYAVSCRLGLSMGGSPGGKPEREGVEGVEEKKQKKKDTWSRFIL